MPLHRDWMAVKIFKSLQYPKLFFFFIPDAFDYKRIVIWSKLVDDIKPVSFNNVAHISQRPGETVPEQKMLFSPEIFLKCKVFLPKVFVLELSEPDTDVMPDVAVTRSLDRHPQLQMSWRQKIAWALGEGHWIPIILLSGIWLNVKWPVHYITWTQPSSI